MPYSFVRSEMPKAPATYCALRMRTRIAVMIVPHKTHAFPATSRWLLLQSNDALSPARDALSPAPVAREDKFIRAGCQSQLHRLFPRGVIVAHKRWGLSQEKWPC